MADQSTDAFRQLFDLLSTSENAVKNEKLSKRLKKFAKKNASIELLDGATFTEIITNNLLNLPVIRILEKLVEKITVDDSNVNFISAIFDNPDFDSFVFTTKNDNFSDVKFVVLNLVKSLALRFTEFPLENHIPKILGVYNATLHPTDELCLQLLHIYEKKFDLSKFYPVIWGATGLEKYANLKLLGPALWNRPDPKDVLDLIDSNRMLKSSKLVPLDINFDIFNEKKFVTRDADSIYDPRFILPLFNSLLGSDSVLSCKIFIQKNCLSFVVACFSCRDENVRAAAYVVMEKFSQHLDGSTVETLDGRSQLLWILNFLKNSIEKPYQRLPSVISQFFCKSFYLMLNPYDRMFPIISSFLLLKPVLALNRVPEFYKLFHSCSLDCCQERQWILQLMLDGFRDPEDYRIFENRFLIKLLLSFWPCCLCDVKCREIIGRIIKVACSFEYCAMDLSKRHNIYGWISSNLTLAFNSCDSGQIVSLLAILMELGETLNKDPERFKKFRILWLSCFALFLRKNIVNTQFKPPKNMRDNLCDCANVFLNCLDQSRDEVVELKTLMQ